MMNKAQRDYNLSIMPGWARKQPDPSPEEVHQLILDEVGKDVIWPQRFQVLLKLYKEEGPISLGQGDKKIEIDRPEDFQQQFAFDTRTARILAFGPDAFTHREMFPNGSPWSIGQWILFIKYENSFINVNGHQLCYLQDIKMTFSVKDPRELDTNINIGN